MSLIWLYALRRRADTDLQVIPDFHHCIHIQILFDLIYNGCAVHLSHACVALVHVYKADKAQDADHKTEIEAAACLFFLLLLCTAVQIMIKPPVSGMDSRDVPALIVQP